MTSQLTLSKKAKQFAKACNEENTQQSQAVKFVSAELDLRWKSHIKTILRIIRQAKIKWKVQMQRLGELTSSHYWRQYPSYIWSVLHYGAIIYSFNNTNSLKKLDTVHNEELRITTGALQNSSTHRMQAETCLLLRLHHRNSQILNYCDRYTPLQINVYEARHIQYSTGLAFTVQKIIISKSILVFLQTICEKQIF